MSVCDDFFTFVVACYVVYKLFMTVQPDKCFKIFRGPVEEADHHGLMFFGVARWICFEIEEANVCVWINRSFFDDCHFSEVEIFDGLVDRKIYFDGCVYLSELVGSNWDLLPVPNYVQTLDDCSRVILEVMVSTVWLDDHCKLKRFSGLGFAVFVDVFFIVWVIRFVFVKLDLSPEYLRNF